MIVPDQKTVPARISTVLWDFGPELSDMVRGTKLINSVRVRTLGP